jgi:hypothetical protein
LVASVVRSQLFNFCQGGAGRRSEDIRSLSQLKFSNVTLSETDDAIQTETCSFSEKEADAVADSIACLLTFNAQPSSSDTSIIYYVSGAIARSTIAATKCEHCREALINPHDVEPVALETNADPGAAGFMEIVNRGRLVHPSDFV